MLYEVTFRSGKSTDLIRANSAQEAREIGEKEFGKVQSVKVLPDSIHDEEDEEEDEEQEEPEDDDDEDDE